MSREQAIMVFAVAVFVGGPAGLATLDIVLWAGRLRNRLPRLRWLGILAEQAMTVH
jgi:hypothetical protein